MKPTYLYVERWSNGRCYIGQTMYPKRRHTRHTNGSSKGSWYIRQEITAQGGILPEMTILAIFDVKVSYPMRGTYEHVITRIAEKAGWDLIWKSGD